MKTLRLSILTILIAVLVPIGTFSNLDAQGQSVIVSTDKTSYHYGENYTISGKVNPVVPGQVISIMIQSPDYPHPV